MIGAYNPHEHNHTEWTDDQLWQEADRLGKMLRADHEPRYTGERREQISKQMSLVALEQYMRHQERLCSE